MKKKLAWLLALCLLLTSVGVFPVSLAEGEGEAATEIVAAGEPEEAPAAEPAAPVVEETEPETEPC